MLYKTVDRTIDLLSFTPLVGILPVSTSPHFIAGVLRRQVEDTADGYLLRLPNRYITGKHRWTVNDVARALAPYSPEQEDGHERIYDGSYADNTSSQNFMISQNVVKGAVKRIIVSGLTEGQLEKLISSLAAQRVSKVQAKTLVS